MDFPLAVFHFSVEITPFGTASPMCGAAFAECDGLEIGLDVKTIREGGNNGAQIRLVGPATFGHLTLKRGMTTDISLWEWVERTIREPGLRATGEVVVFDRSGVNPQLKFVLERCVPIKIKAPPLNAREGAIAIEQLEVGYETFSMSSLGVPPEPDPKGVKPAMWTGGGNSAIRTGG